MSNILLNHILKTDRPASKLELVEMWLKLSIQNQIGIALENKDSPSLWNDGYLECLQDLKEVLSK